MEKKDLNKLLIKVGIPIVVIFLFLIFLFNLWVKSILKDSSKLKTKISVNERMAPGEITKTKPRTFLERKPPINNQSGVNLNDDIQDTQKINSDTSNPEETGKSTSSYKHKQFKTRSEPFLIN